MTTATITETAPRPRGYGALWRALPRELLEHVEARFLVALRERARHLHHLIEEVFDELRGLEGEHRLGSGLLDGLTQLGAPHRPQPEATCGPAVPWKRSCEVRLEVGTHGG